MKLKATASVLLLGFCFSALAAVPAQATSPTPEPSPVSSADLGPGTDQKIIETKDPGQDGGMSVAEFKAVLSKEGGVSYSPDPTDPTLVVTDWPEEGLSRVVQKAPEAATANDTAAAPQAARGARYCVTRIPLLTMVPGGLQWGAEQTCEGDFAPQYIIATLQDTCDGPFCIVWENKRGPWRSSYSQDYSRVSKVGSIAACSTNENRKLRVKVERWNGGVKYNDMYHPDAVRPCNIRP